jgi:hypothetical protein
MLRSGQTKNYNIGICCFSAYVNFHILTFFSNNTRQNFIKIFLNVPAQMLPFVVIVNSIWLPELLIVEVIMKHPT